MATSYDRVTFRRENGRSRSIIIRDMRARFNDVLDCVVYSGFAVTRDGDEADGPRRFYLFTQRDLVKRVPMRLNLKYGELEVTTDDARLPYYPTDGR